MKVMKSRMTISAGWILMLAGTFFLVITHRLDLLLIAAPVAAFFSYRSSRGVTRGNTVQRRM
jgi:hypothetical protein